MARILIADDSDLDRELTARGVRRAASDIATIVCEDGEAALEQLLADPEIRLVLLDHRMPKMGAEEVLRAIPADRLETLVVILFSSAVSPANVERCLQLGAQAYVEKPTDPTDYNQAVRGIVEREW